MALFEKKTGTGQHLPGMDLSLVQLQALTTLSRPVRGWIRSTRSRLGITGVQMAQRMAVQPPRVVEMERAELNKALTLKTLERAANAMGYRLVYALIPKDGTEPVGSPIPGNQSQLLSEEEVSNLRQPLIKTHSELRQWVEEGIRSAEARVGKKKPRNLLTEKFLLRLHQIMFGKVWKDSGKFRTTELVQGQKVLAGDGLSPTQRDVAAKLRSLLENAQYWATAGTYSADEAGARFYSRMVAIEPFKNGSEAIAELMTDLILVHVYRQPRFTWGQRANAEPSEVEVARHKALRAAEGRDFGPLIHWARS